jgi:hypothetical protein
MGSRPSNPSPRERSLGFGPAANAQYLLSIYLESIWPHIPKPLDARVGGTASLELAEILMWHWPPHAALFSESAVW